MKMQQLVRRFLRPEVFRYIITGAFATVLQYTFYVILVKAAAMSAEYAAVGSYCISLCANFVLSNFFTFRTRPNARKAASFLTSHMINLGLQTLLVAIFARFMDESMALLPAMAICIPINFCLVSFSLTSKWVESR